MVEPPGPWKYSIVIGVGCPAASVVAVPQLGVGGAPCKFQSFSTGVPDAGPIQMRLPSSEMAPNW
jgi:hypothetical protein